MVGQVVDVEQLGELTKVGRGGQGIVYRTAKGGTRFAPTIVYKKYTAATLTGINFGALTEMPALVEDALSNTEAEQLVSIAAWPCALVNANGDLTGFVMPAIPDRFYIPIHTVKGAEQAPAEFQHLLNTREFVAARGITINDTQRYTLLREVASALTFLHHHGIVVGDISPKNLLFALNPEAVYFVDCDTMTINGVCALPPVETPGWEVPAGENPATVHSDTYKLGLLALRLLAGDQDTKNPQHLPDSTPNSLRRIITDTLTNPPTTRPLPQAWTYILTTAVEDTTPTTASQPRIHATPPPTTTTPQPVMRSRPTTSTTTGPQNRQTQQTPPTHISATSSPFTGWKIPASAVASAGPKWPKKHTAILAAAMLGVSVLIGIFVIMQHQRAPLAVFDGTFTATYGVQTDFAGNNPTQSDTSGLTWVVRSACDGDHCVAEATTRNRPGGELRATFDYIDGRWLSVYTRSDIDCGGTELWAAFSLQATAGGSLAGEFRFAHADGNNCNGKRPVTFTRTGEPDPSVRVLDPSRLGAPRVSPAQALRGAYRYTVDYKSSGSKFEYDYRAETLCLRSGERCLTFFSRSEGQQPLIFAGQAWSHTRSADNTCSNGQPAKEEISVTVPLPDPRYDPIVVLTGTGVQKTLTGCPGSKDFDVMIQRTGD